ncbi:MAG: hypothetical protein HYW77_01590 [Parcubacteria group bacterium]|nr:hypothetical protein [Parcubacteria group bacterium]
MENNIEKQINLAGNVDTQGVSTKVDIKPVIDPETKKKLEELEEKRQKRIKTLRNTVWGVAAILGIIILAVIIFSSGNDKIETTNKVQTDKEGAFAFESIKGFFISNPSSTTSNSNIVSQQSNTVSNQSQTQSNQSTTQTTRTYSREEILVAKVLDSLYGFGPSTGTTTSVNSSTSTVSNSGQVAGAQIIQNGFGFVQGASGNGLRNSFLVKVKGDARVYEIIQGQKHLIPNNVIFEDYGFDSRTIRLVTQRELNLWPRAKILHQIGDTKIWYLTEVGYVRLVPNREVFISYGDRIEDVIQVSPLELAFYPRVKYIHLEDGEDNRIWLIEGATKYPINPLAFLRLRIKFIEIAPVNQKEFDFYKVGPEIN